MRKNSNKNFKHKHSLGQNFITDEFLLEDIADESGINENDFVLEIGPGNGALTRCLCARAKYVVTVEIDKSLIPLLRSNLKEYNNVSIINADFLNLDFQEILNSFSTAVGAKHCEPAPVGANADCIGAKLCEPAPVGAKLCEPIKVVANLPYYITSPIIQNLLQNPHICDMTLMVQKEVAERIVAIPGNRDYGVLTLACNYFADTEMIMIVSKDCFYPKPKVDSAVVHFKKHSIGANADIVGANTDFVGAKHCESQTFDKNYEKLFKLIKASFSERRKKLINSLINAGYNKDLLLSAFSKLNFDENIRAENLSLDDYRKLLNEL